MSVRKPQLEKSPSRGGKDHRSEATSAEVARFENAVANWALKWAGGDQRKAASVLGVDPAKLQEKLRAPPPVPAPPRAAQAAGASAKHAEAPAVKRGRGRPRKEPTLELSPQEEQVARGRLLGPRPETFLEIGTRLGLTSERARQLMVAADEKLLARARLLYADHPLFKKKG